MNTDDEKPFGFLQEDFHSEVLSFLFELISIKYPNKKMILYNEVDRYNNRELYTKIYKNLEVRSLEYYIHDMANRVCEKIFIVSYDNVIHLKLLLPYRDNLVFIAHSTKHIKACQKYNLAYFSLTSLLSTNFMLPISKNCLTDHSEVEGYKIHNEKITDTMKNINEKRHNENKEILMVIGLFVDHNKDIPLLQELLDTQKYILIIYTHEIVPTLQKFVDKNQSCVFVALNLPTTDLIYHINYFDIKYLLFTPPQKSNFYISSWSGSIQFAFDHNLHIIMPSVLADLYNLKNPALIAYNSADDIVNGIDSNNVLEYSYQDVRNKIFERNIIVFDILLNRIPTSKIGHYTIDYQNTEYINTKVALYQQTITTHNLKPEDLVNKNILLIDPQNTIFSLTLLLLERSCNFIQFIPDINRAKYYKQIAISNNMDNKIKFYNALLGSKNKSNHNETLDIFRLDDLNIDDVSIIYINSDSFNEMIKGGMKTIERYKPLFYVSFQDEILWDLDDTLLLTLGYIKTEYEKYIIYKHSKTTVADEHSETTIAHENIET